MERLREQLSEQYEKLVRQKRSFDAWASECREEAEQQAARLQARNDDLHRREADMARQVCRAAPRPKSSELQQEIRRLRTQSLLAHSQVELPA